jgi:hypothetical protein
MGKVIGLKKIWLDVELYVRALVEGVIPKPRVLSSGARDLP